MKSVCCVVTVLCFAPVLYAGQLGTGRPWITEATPTGNLELNNDDYVGSFDDNPNHFNVNARTGFGAGNSQSIVSTERTIVTAPSGGSTEYAMTLGGRYSDSDASEGVNLDSVFRVQLGFGTGDNFVAARNLAPDLKFDATGEVNPPIEDVFAAVGQIPILKLIDHQSDTLVFQGSSRSGALSQINFARNELFRLPLDIPDLPDSLRDLYASSELLGLKPAEVPFTIRVQPVPPSAQAGDFDGDGELTLVDIKLLSWASSIGTNNPIYDVNGDGMVDQGDVFLWTYSQDYKNTWTGDANLDGEFDSGDFVQVFRAGKYEMDVDATWDEGDWNGDYRFDTEDFVAAFQANGYEIGPRALAAAVPEPSQFNLVWLLVLGLSVRAFPRGHRATCQRAL
jgi:hypothetical protein